MKVTRLLTEDVALLGANLEIIVTHEDLTEATAATAQTLEALVATANYQMFEVVRAELLEAFEDTADAANNTTTVQIGDGGDTDRLLTSTQLNKNGAEVFIKAGTGTKHVFTAADTVDILFGAPAADKTLAALNKGKLRVLLNVFDSRNAIGN